MFKYYNAFTNTKGDSLPGYYARVFDAAGNQINLFADLSGTPISTVSGVVNAALSDDNGMYRWYCANGTYDIRFYDVNDVFVSVEIGVPMFEASGVYDDLSASTGAALVGFLQSGTGAVARTAQAKARESVSLGDFMLVSGGNPRDALEKAATAARVVNIYGGTYLFDQAADVASDTTIIGHGCMIGAAASGYTDPNLINFLGSGEMAGTGFMVGANMPSPVSSWAGPGTPIGSAVFASGTSNVARAHTLKVTGWTFSGFRGGPIYGKWLDRLEVDGCAFIGNQLATLMYKASGSYVNIPTTSTLANEIVTNQNIEVYQTTEAIVTRCAVRDILSKGISLNADYVTTQGNNYVGASPRHCMEHLTGCASVIATGNQYDGGADMGDAIKTVDCEAGTIGGGAIRNSLIAIYPQDCGTLTMLPINMENVGTAYYPAHSEDATQDMAITGHVGEVLGDGSGDFLAIASHADAVTAGYGMSIRLIGGHAKNFDYGMLHKTPGLGMILDIALVGGIHFEDCTVAGVDLRARNIEFNGKFTNCNDSMAIGSTTKSVGPVVTASKRASVQAIFDGCSGAHCRVGAQALYDFQFDQISLHLEGDGGTRILAFGLDGSDSLLLFNLNVAGTEQTTVASAVYVDAGSKTVKGVFEVAIIDGSGSPNNITFEGAASLTGPFLTRVCGITGAHGMTL